MPTIWEILPWAVAILAIVAAAGFSWLLFLGIIEEIRSLAESFRASRYVARLKKERRAKPDRV